ncbi:hypothetical protein HWV62_43266 [Athelia sp. TMB]|nr:hypothetical protein HWV62_43266 [Athelia sp. TMB]
MSIFHHQNRSAPRSPSLESSTSITSALSSDQDIATMDHLTATKPPSINTSLAASVAGGLGELPPVEEMMETIIKAWQQQKQRSEMSASIKSLSVSSATAPEIHSSTLPPAPAYEKHGRFYLPLKHIYFLVNNTIYSVPRAPFDTQSAAFIGRGLAEHEPIVLEDVTIAQFDQFLSILYPSEYGVYTATSVDDWSALLHLADLWGFKSIRALAIKQLAPIATAIDKIVLGRRFAINEWLLDGYYDVCIREDPLTEEDGARLSNQDVVRIFTAREQFGSGYPKFASTPISTLEINKRFQLQLPFAFDASLPASPKSIAAVEPSESPNDFIPFDNLPPLEKEKEKMHREVEEETEVNCKPLEMPFVSRFSWGSGTVFGVADDSAPIPEQPKKEEDDDLWCAPKKIQKKKKAKVGASSAAGMPWV